MTRPTSSFAALLLGITLGLGLAVCGWFVGQGLYAARASDRFVTVRGLSEREVAADLAIWPIVFTATGDELGRVQSDLEATAGIVAAFLAERGFEAGETSRSSPRITDFTAQGFGRENGPRQRYSAEATVTLRSSKVEAVRRAIEDSGELVRRGVSLIRSYEFSTEYLFTALDSIKPEMIAEATRDARSAAQQFAEDSGSRVGSIRRATQGYFSIDARDAFSPEFKRVRVVTTVEFFLVDG